MSRILFVGHEATRTGAPMMLLNAMRWLGQHTDWSFELILQEPGPVLAEYRSLARTSVCRPSWATRWKRSGSRVRRRIARAYHDLSTHLLRRRVERLRPDLIFFNTVACGEVFDVLAPLGIPTVVHVHELEGVIQSLGPSTVGRLEAAGSRYIAASQAVANNLVDRHGVDPDRIATVHEFIEIPSVPAGDAVANNRAFRESLGIPLNAWLIGGCGTIERRKGVDLFVEAARQARLLAPGAPIHFAWLGRSLGNEYAAQIEEQIRRDGLGDMVHLIGESSAPFAMMQHFDAFALTSREDPYPLAMLEAGALGVPIVGFAGSGGAPEFIEDDAGVVVPFEDCRAMAGALLGLAANPARSRAMGSRAAAKLRERHTVELNAPRIFDLIRRPVAPAARDLELALATR